MRQPGLYDRLKCDLGPPDTEDFQAELQVYEQTRNMAAGLHEHCRPDKFATPPKTCACWTNSISVTPRVAAFSYCRIVPPLAGQPEAGWMSVGASLTNAAEISIPRSGFWPRFHRFSASKRLPNSTRPWGPIAPGCKITGLTRN